MEEIENNYKCYGIIKGDTIKSRQTEDLMKENDEKMLLKSIDKSDIEVTFQSMKSGASMRKRGLFLDASNLR